MLTRDKKDEEGAIKLYKQVVDLARKEGDNTTMRLFQKILGEEEEHHDTFTGLLEGI
jgi:bacterioferritin